MNPAQLLNHFDRISEAPDAIPRLRRFVVDLSVRGKLVEQRDNDEPASDLLNRIQAEKARLVKAGDIRKQEVLVAIEPEEVPFEVPKSWALVRLGDALELINGRTFRPNEWGKSGLPIIRIQNLNNSDAPFNYCDLPIPEKFHVRTSDFLISWSGTPGTSFGAHIWERGHALLNQHIFRTELIGTAFLPAFLKLAINSRLLELIDQAHGGVGLQHITKPKLENLPLTLPPLSEQHRIVAKVDELMGLCDQLEAAQAERERRRDRLAAASLHRLNQPAYADAPEVLRANARFYLNHLPCLAARPDQIKKLRQTILNLAVRGQLVPQNPIDEPATELLKRIRAERAGSDSPPPPIDEDSVPFRLPLGWQWVRFGELITAAGAGWSPKSEGFPRSGDTWGVLKVSSVSWDRFLACENKQLLPGVTPPERAQVHTGDFLISRANTSELVAKCVVVDREPRNLILSDKIVRLQIVGSCNKKFLCLVNNHAAYARSYYAEEASGTSLSMKNVSRGVIYALPIPLPPSAEQHRIVAKVDQLMSLCDQLEAQLTTAQTERRSLLEAVLHEALPII
jgi:type I restriction enzyme, S subunit